MRNLFPRKLTAAVFAALILSLGLAAASAEAHPGFHGFHGWGGWYGHYAVHDDCFTQRRVFVDRYDRLHVRYVNVCY
ncbi:MAG: hypothetical protein ABSA13_02425 [Beijerinckiaceae bacterium]|jgi:hypothetical protein